MKIKKATIVASVVTLVILTMNSFSHGDCCESCKGTFYVAGSGALVWHNDLKSRTGFIQDEFEYKTGWGAAASAGGIFDMVGAWDVRLEVEYVYRRNKLRDLIVNIDNIIDISFPVSGHNQDRAAMFNFLVDVAICCGFSIYYGAGIGVSWNEIKINFGDISEVVRDELFAWQILAGLAYFVRPWLEVTVGYRLFATTRTDRFDNYDFSPHRVPIANNLEAGLRIRF